MTRKDLRPLAFLAALVLIAFGPVLFTGRSFFLGDLPYYHHPWRALETEMLQRGMFPKWDPYAYMGMPLWATMETGGFTPAALPFHLFPFAAAYKLHLVFHHLLAAFFAYLWLRRGSGRAGAAAGAAVFALCGFLMVRVENLNITATLAWWPAFFLFASRPVLLGLAMAASLLGGYPQIWAAMAGATLVSPWIWKDRGAWKPWAAGAGLAFLLAAGMLLPGAEFAARSTRKEGLSLEERTVNSLTLSDMAGFASPAFTPLSDRVAGARYSFWKTEYVGSIALLLAVLGALRLRRRRLAWASGLLLLTLVILHGHNDPVALALWDKLPPLHFIRYPANLTFLVLALVAPLAALGLRGRRVASLAALAVGLELLMYGWNMHPTIPDRFFTDRGPLVEWLSTHLGRHRFAASPQAALLLRGYGDDMEASAFDVKHRLYGRSSIPFHLQGATALGEALINAESYAVMDLLFRQPSAGAALALLPWVDVSVLMTRVVQPALGKAEAEVLWPLYATKGPERARWIPEAEAAKLSGTLDQAPSIKGAQPLHYAQTREDRFTVIGVAPAPGSIFIADPLFPGWTVYAPDEGNRIVERATALGAFQRIKAEKAQVWLEGVYRPSSLSVGLAISTLCAAALAGWAFLRLRAA